MKRNFRKKWGAIALTTVIMFGSLPMSVSAAGDCANGIHTPGEKMNANYVPCDGGYKVDHYMCEVCGEAVDANGNPVTYFEGSGVHEIVTDKKYEPDYTDCVGGFKDDIYRCKYNCDNFFDINGKYLTWYEPTRSNHDYEEIAAKAPTYEEDGNLKYWHCKVCGWNFKEASDESYIEDLEDVILPKLSKPQVDIKNGLDKVPEGVAGKYTSVKEVENALAQKALNANPDFKADNTKSVLMDVTLKVKNANGEWETVTYKNFPTEGVETLLPYPEGTNKDNFDFVVAHMITAGDKAGEIEILNYVLEENGIRVKFTSMSPVMIMYQAKNENDTSTNAASPKTGDTSNMLLLFVMLLASGSATVFLIGKKKFI